MSRKALPIHVDMLLIIVIDYLISFLIFTKVSSQLLSYDYSVKHEHSLAFLRLGYMQ